MSYIKYTILPQINAICSYKNVGHKKDWNPQNTNLHFETLSTPGLYFFLATIQYQSMSNLL